MGIADAVTMAAADAAVKWWEGKRPIGWDLDQHFQNPTVNTTGDAEYWLAVRAASWAFMLEGRNHPYPRVAPYKSRSVPRHAKRGICTRCGRDVCVTKDGITFSHENPNGKERHRAFAKISGKAGQ